MPEQRGRLVAVAAGLVERVDDRVGLGGLEHRQPRGAREAERRQVRRLDHPDRLAGHDVAQHVLELGDVARPRVALEHPDHLVGQPQRPRPAGRAQHRPGDLGELVAAVAQGRDADGLVEVAQEQPVGPAGVDRRAVEAADDDHAARQHRQRAQRLVEPARAARGERVDLVEQHQVAPRRRSSPTSPESSGAGARRAPRSRSSSRWRPGRGGRTAPGRACASRHPPPPRAAGDDGGRGSR